MAREAEARTEGDDDVRRKSHQQQTGKAPPASDVAALIPKLRERLERSASGYVRVARISVADRSALSLMIERGEVEIFDSPLGRAYRLVVAERAGEK